MRQRWDRCFPARRSLAAGAVPAAVPALSAALLLAWPVCGPGAPVAPDPHHAQVATRLARHLPREHLTHRPMDDTMSARAWTNFLQVLDYDRVYFLRSDIEAFAPGVTNLDDQLKEGNVQFAVSVFETFRQRVRNRCQYVDELLRKGFDLTADETYVWRRRDAPWPADEAEWNELWRKRVKNEYVRETIVRELAKEEQRNATNRPPAAAVATNAVAAATNAAAGSAPLAAKPPPSIEETIAQHYRQMLTVFQDSDAEWLMERFFSAFAHAYDPHSDYMSPSAVEDFNIEMKLSLVGIGALLRSEDGAAKIVRLIPGGPAERDKRLRPGDRIIAVAQGDDPAVDIRHWPLQKAVSIIRGRKGTRVVLTVIPASDAAGTTSQQIDLIRDEVKLEDQAAKLHIQELPQEGGKPCRLGIISLPAFYANMRATSKDSPEYRSAAQDVRNLLLKAVKEGVEGIVLNLRNNGGGSLLEAIEMTGLFIAGGPAVQVHEVQGVTVLMDRDPGVVYAGPLVVLVNRLSASASEILAGALQDYGRAVIVGDSKTHGKGSVQAIRQLGADARFGSVKTTSSVFYRISGGSTQLRGVMPDIQVRSPFDVMELGEEYLPNPLPWSAVPPASYSATTNLAAAFPILRERSAKRCREDARFVSYGKLLDRVRELNQSRELPLRLSERMSMAKMEREMASMQRSYASDDEEAPSPGGPLKLDLVLEESLWILRDLVGLNGQPEEAPPSGVNAQKNLSQAIENWLMKRL